MLAPSASARPKPSYAAHSQSRMGTGRVRYLVILPEVPVEETRIKALVAALAGTAASSSTKGTSNPWTDCRRFLTAISLPLGPFGSPITNSALGARLSTTKLQEIVRKTAGGPLSGKTRVT